MTRLGAFVAVVLLCGLAACEDEPTPDIPASPTPSTSSPTVTESTSPITPTETPEALTPEETVRAWVESHNRALSTGDTSAERALAASDCLGCDVFVDPIDEVYADGGGYRGGMWRLVSTNIDDQSSSDVRLSAAIRVAQGALIPEAGAPPQPYEAKSQLMRLELRREGGEWLFTVIAFIS